MSDVGVNKFSAVKFIICRAWSVKTLLVYSEFSSKACGRTRNLINTDLLNVPSQGFSILFFLLHLNCSNSTFTLTAWGHVYIETEVGVDCKSSLSVYPGNFKFNSHRDLCLMYVYNCHGLRCISIHCMYW